MTTPPARCADLIPQGWREPVPGAPVPDTRGAAPLEAEKAWAGGFVAQAGQLAKANGRTADTIHIVTECERLANEARPKK